MNLKNIFSGKSKFEGVDPNDEHRDFKLMESVFVDAFEEQKKARRWGIAFKSLTFAYLFVVLILFYAGTKSVGGKGPGKPHTAMIEVSGVIASDKPAVAWKINAGLKAAFENEEAKAIILAINSPGGSPVQAGEVYDEILRLKGEYPEKKVYAVIGELGASGAYYIAAAADEIYANRSSLVGSIGVTAAGFGFVDTIEKLGVERRKFTSGEHKGFLDPFSPLREDEVTFWQTVLGSTHQQFIDAVKQGRGDRLEMTEEITSGLIWNGEQAKDLGLVDGLASVKKVARDIVGEEKLVDYTRREPPLKELLGSFGVSVGQGIFKSLKAEESYPDIR